MASSNRKSEKFYLSRGLGYLFLRLIAAKNCPDRLEVGRDKA